MLVSEESAPPTTVSSGSATQIATPEPASAGGSAVGAKDAKNSPPNGKAEDGPDAEGPDGAAGDHDVGNDDEDSEEEEDLDADERREREMRMKKLTALLARSGIYSKIMSERMAAERAARAAAPPPEAQQAGEPSHPRTRGSRKRRVQISDILSETDLTQAGSEDKSQQKSKRVKGEDGTAKPSEQKAPEEEGKNGLPPQPVLVTGATLRDYQLEGVAWLVSLYENGLNGILADEMGLGKTLQTISFLAHLRAHQVWGPFLIVAPLSTIYNWEAEFQRFTPDIPALVYHGNATERQQLRAERLVMPPSAGGRSHHHKNKTQAQDKFPVVITSYEMVLRDRAGLQRYPWKYVVVDEGHRLKNFNSKLVQELKTYSMAQRLILTGTPLQNNLSELWSLLNFILPDIFDDLDTFEEWFDFADANNTSQNRSRRKSRMSKIQTKEVVSQLHAILKPFMLRRLKSEAERDLPPKQEYLLYTQLTSEQVDLYNAAINGSLRSLLIRLKTGMSAELVHKIMLQQNDPEALASQNGRRGVMGETDADQEKELASEVPSSSKRRSGRARRSTAQRSVQKSLFDYPQGISSSQGGAQPVRPSQLADYREALQEVRALHLDNLVMQLRKLCNHPYLLHWPHDEQNILATQDLVKVSGKMQLLARLLPVLLDRGHRILIFTEFTNMMDILEIWLEDEWGEKPCRIDGSRSGAERREQMNAFNSPEGAGGGVFILSTRAGGLGINLAAADTVIFFDSDWNPAVDAQAQDRAHRIGQTKPVLVFRLAAANTIEQRILNSAQSKRRLEELVISKGRHLDQSAFSQQQEVLDLARLEPADPEKSGLTEQQLEQLLDRSPDAMARPLGWSLGCALVTETRADGTSDEVARMMAAES